MVKKCGKGTLRAQQGHNRFSIVKKRFNNGCNGAIQFSKVTKILTKR